MRLWHGGGECGHYHAEGLTLTGTTLTLDTGTKRTGTRSYKFDSSAIAHLAVPIIGVVGRTYFACGHFLLPAATGLPSADAVIASFATGAGFLGGAMLTTTGKLRLVSTAFAQVGSDSVDTITTDTWYRVELVCEINSGTNDDLLSLYLNGTLVATSSVENRGTVAPTIFRFGWSDTDPGTSEVIFWDDLALNDEQGSVNNTLVGDQRIYALHPTADSAIGNWRDGAGGSTNIFGSVDNIPPTGVATASSGATNQVENAVATAPNSYDATMQTYTAAGIDAGHTITAIIPMVEIGSSSTTGSDSISHSVVSNPAIAATAASCDIVAGTYPTGWNFSRGIVSENPSVVRGTAPVMRITKNVATSRVNACCMMAMLVASTSAAPPPPATRYHSIIMVG
jgi:hypothetical protein